jgi:hypothetical protein
MAAASQNISFPRVTLFGKPVERVAKLHDKRPECADGDKDRQNTL